MQKFVILLAWFATFQTNSNIHDVIDGEIQIRFIMILSNLKKWKNQK